MGWLSLASKTLTIVAYLMTSFVLLSVNQKIKQERVIDQTVIDQMNLEQGVVIFAIILAALAWSLDFLQEFRDLNSKSTKK
jgi:hypothetical protein